jgi:hypothetical protein
MDFSFSIDFPQSQQGDTIRPCRDSPFSPAKDMITIHTTGESRNMRFLAFQGRLVVVGQKRPGWFIKPCIREKSGPSEIRNSGVGELPRAEEQIAVDAICGGACHDGAGLCGRSRVPCLDAYRHAAARFFKGLREPEDAGDVCPLVD